MLDRLIETLEKHAQRSLDSSVQSQIAEKLGWILVTGTDDNFNQHPPAGSPDSGPVALAFPERNSF